MKAAPYILARTLGDAHEFAREELGLSRGTYRIVNSPSTIKAVRGVDLYLVPGYQNRFDRFAMAGAIKWTRLNVIDVAELRAQEPQPDPVVTEALGEIVDDLDPPGAQLMLVSDEEAHAFLDVSNGDTMISEGGPVTPEPEVKNRRRRRCKECGTLHFKEDSCPSEILPGV